MVSWALQRTAESTEEAALSLEDWQAEFLWKHPEYQDRYFYGTPRGEREVVVLMLV